MWPFFTLKLQKQKLADSINKVLSQADLRKKIRKFSIILVTPIFSIFFTLLIMEGFIRAFLHPSEAPDIYFNNNLGNLFVPNQTGYYIKGKNSEIIAKFNINKQGWNSPYDYIETKSPTIKRFAFIGDSFIESLQVNYDKSYPYLLNEKLKNKNVDVYTFGHSGANLIHYSHMMDFVGNKYQPDLVFVNIVSNDFKESLSGYNRIDNWSLIYNNKGFSQKSPREVSNLAIKRLARKSALVRYLTINLDLINTSPFLNKIFYAETRQNKLDKNMEELFDGNQFLESMVEYILQQFLTISKDNKFKLVLVLDTDRQAIYGNQDLYKTENYRYRSAVKTAAKKFNINVIDLTEIFQKDWQVNHKRFDWSIDDHWNEYGHELVVNTINNWLNSFNKNYKLF
ncbi:SGNH/GDSL hydrolase family protein [Candidatus Microgenomates bacterium]|nr:SGNH/GDSL hydrolase family protein [Candidatus Microgenomates bacterium]